MSACPGCGEEHEDMETLAGGPDPAITVQSIDTFRALTTLRIAQISEGEEDVDEAGLMAAVTPVKDIATVIMYLRHSIASSDDEEMKALMAKMLESVEIITQMATLGPLVVGRLVMAQYLREWTPREKFSARWADEVSEHIPLFIGND